MKCIYNYDIFRKDNGGEVRYFSIILLVLVLPVNIYGFNIKDYDVNRSVNEKVVPTISQLEDARFLSDTISKINNYIKNNPKDVNGYILRNLYVFMLWDVYPLSLKKQLTILGMKYSIETSKKFPENADGWTNRAIFLGIYGLEKGVLNALQLAPTIKKYCEKSRKINKTHYYSIATQVLGRMYFKLPPFPTSFGDEAKGEIYLKEVLKNAPGLVNNYVYLAEIEFAKGHSKKSIQWLSKIEKIKPKTWYEKREKIRILRIVPKLKKMFKNGTFDKMDYDILLDTKRNKD